MRPQLIASSLLLLALACNKQSISKSAAEAGPQYVAKTWVTGGAKAADKLPLIVLIHGLGDRPEGIAPLLSQVTQPARIVAPLAPTKYGNGGAWFTIRVAQGDLTCLSKQMQQAAKELSQWLQKFQKTHPTLGKPIVTGFSQGGMLAFALATHHGEQIQAAFPVGGWLPPPLLNLSLQEQQNLAPIVAFHGEADRIVPLAPTEISVNNLKAQGAKVRLKTYPHVGHHITSQMQQELTQLLDAELQKFSYPKAR